MQEREVMIALPIPHTRIPTNMITGILILGAGIVTASAATFAPELDVRWAILTMAGSMMVSAMAWMLNEREESRKKVFGRAIGAMLVGVCGSRAFWHYSDWAKNSLQDPLLMLGAGAVFGFVGYMLAAALVKASSKRADSIVGQGMDRWLPQQDLPDDIKHAKNHGRED